MKKSLIALAVLECAAGVASAGQAPPTGVISFQTGALMNPGGGSGDVTSMKTINGGGSGGIALVNGGGSSYLTAQAWAASLGTATMAAQAPPDTHRSFVSI